MNFLKRVIFKILKMFGYQDYCADKNTTIGWHTYIGQGTHITKTKIGNYCSIGTNVLIGPGDHDFSKVSTSMEFCDEDAYENLTQNDCEIGHDVWIGANAIILRGVTVGTGAVVGASAVVTKSVPPYAVVAGVPAKIIKYRFSEARIAELLESKWFMQQKEAAKSTVIRLGNG